MSQDGLLLIIPYESLSPEALSQLIQEYCLRDWGVNEVETPLESRLQAVRQAVTIGEFGVLYSELHETASLVSADQIDLVSEDA